MLPKWVGELGVIAPLLVGVRRRGKERGLTLLTLWPAQEA